MAIQGLEPYGHVAVFLDFEEKTARAQPDQSPNLGRARADAMEEIANMVAPASLNHDRKKAPNAGSTIQRDRVVTPTREGEAGGCLLEAGQPQISVVRFSATDFVAALLPGIGVACVLMHGSLPPSLFGRNIDGIITPHGCQARRLAIHEKSYVRYLFTTFLVIVRRKTVRLDKTRKREFGLPAGHAAPWR